MGGNNIFSFASLALEREIKENKYAHCIAEYPIINNVLSYNSHHFYQGLAQFKIVSWLL